MAIQYVWHGSTGTPDGLTEATAWHNISDASLASGNTIKMARDHVDANSPYSANVTIYGPTAGEPATLITYDRSTGEYARATVNCIDNSGGLYDITTHGVNIAGAEFNIGDDFKFDQDLNSRAGMFQVKVNAAPNSKLILRTNSPQRMSIIDVEFLTQSTANTIESSNSEFIDFKANKPTISLFRIGFGSSLSSSDISDLTGLALVESSSVGVTVTGCALPEDLVLSTAA